MNNVRMYCTIPKVSENCIHPSIHPTSTQLNFTTRPLPYPTLPRPNHVSFFLFFSLFFSFWSS